MKLASDLRQYLDLTPRATSDGRALRPVVDVRTAVEHDAIHPLAPAIELSRGLDAAPLTQTTQAGSVEQAATLLDEATAQISAVLARNDLLEQYVDELESRAKAEIRDAEAAAEAWRSAAVEAEERLTTLMQSFDALAERAATAEASFRREQGLLTRLQEKIAATFGVGSELHGKLRAAEGPTGAEDVRSRGSDPEWSGSEDVGRRPSGWHREAA